jgi:hypothetical protein
MWPAEASFSIYNNKNSQQLTAISKWKTEGAVEQQIYTVRLYNVSSLEIRYQIEDLTYSVAYPVEVVIAGLESDSRRKDLASCFPG